MYEYTPPSSPKKVTGTVLLLCAGAALLFFIPAVFPQLPFPWSFQLAGFGLLCAVVYVISRYAAKSFVYRVVPRESSEGYVEGYDLLVTEVTPRSAVTVCRISIENITEIIDLSSEGSAAARKRAVSEGRKRFNYISDLTAPIRCMILTTECGEKLAVSISADSHLLAILGEHPERKDVER